MDEWIKRAMAWTHANLAAHGAPRGTNTLSVTPTGPHMLTECGRFLGIACGLLWAVCFTVAMPRKSPDLDSVAAALTRVVRRGLPVTASTVDPVLLDLRGVIARAADPHDDASRVVALDGVLRGLLARFAEVRYAESARALFGLAPAGSGQTLTVRREVAARAAGHEVHHFRKRVEPRLVERLAAALLADADRFTRSRTIAPRLVPHADRRPVPADPFAWEVAEHEEALSRLWAAIYMLHGELRTVERLISLGANRQQLIRQVVTAAWRWSLASVEADRYVAAFGADAAGGEVSAQELVALAGWAPSLSPEQQSRMRGAAAGGSDRERFVANLHADTALSRTWTDGFLARRESDDSRVDYERQFS